MSPLRTKLELDATQRVIEAMTGHMTTLFRAPNRADSEPTTEADFQPVLDADSLGYLFIGEKIDPTDWLPGIKADQIVADVPMPTPNERQLRPAPRRRRRHAGGDDQGAAAIIEGLQRRGYHFVTVSQLIGKPKAAGLPAP